MRTIGAALVAWAPGMSLAGESRDNLLALTWQPAFCETLPDKPECVRLNDGGLPNSGRALSLHGLWPQPRGKEYCSVPDRLVSTDKNRRWRELPAPDLNPRTAAALIDAMPGVASYLHHHEWIKHGTCYLAAGGADEYFEDALFVLRAVNASAVGDFLADNIGTIVDSNEIRRQFDTAFGDGAGARVSFICKKDDTRILLREIRIGLRGEISPYVSVGTLISAAAPVGIGCNRGMIDPTGLQ